MAFRFLLIFALLNLSFAGSYATWTKEELYWISAFPSSAMPKYLQDILPLYGRSATLNADPVFHAQNAPTNKGVNDPEFGAYWYDYGYKATKEKSTAKSAPTNKGVNDPEFGAYWYDYGYKASEKGSTPTNRVSDGDNSGKESKSAVIPTNKRVNELKFSAYGHVSARKDSESKDAPMNKGVDDPIFGAYWYDYAYKASKKGSTVDNALNDKGVNVNKYESEHKYLVKDLKGNEKSLGRKAYLTDKSAIEDTIFFLEKGLLSDTKVRLPKLIEKPDGAGFLPRKVADSMPMSKDKFLEILKYFSLTPRSQAASYVNITVVNCERENMRGEDKHCATSLEAFVDLGLSMLGKNIKLVSHEFEKETSNPVFTIAEKVQSLGQKNVVCHKMKYPYAVYLCHSIKKTEVYKVPLVGQDGTKVNAVAVCHKDTSAWSPFHISFQILKVKPGTVPICHFLGRDTSVWIPN